MRISVVSSSLDADSRSRVLADRCRNALKDRGHSVDFIDLRQLDPPNFDDDEIYSSEVYQSCHRIIAASDAVILAQSGIQLGVLRRAQEIRRIYRFYAMHLYTYLLKLQLLNALAYRFEYLSSIGRNLFFLLGSVFLWRTAYRGIDQVDGSPRRRWLPMPSLPC